MTKDGDSYHHGNLRAALLESARKQLQTEGIHALSLRALARSTGVSQTAPYRHFTDKNALLAALATDGFTELFEALGPLDPACEPLTAMYEFGMTYLRFARDHTEVFRLMFGPDLQPRNQYPELFNAGREAFHRIENLIELAGRRGNFSIGDTKLAAHTAWAAVHGIATLMLDHADSFGYHRQLDEQAEQALKFMLRGLVAGSGTELPEPVL